MASASLFDNRDNLTLAQWLALLSVKRIHDHEGALQGAAVILICITEFYIMESDITELEFDITESDRTKVEIDKTDSDKTEYDITSIWKVI